MDWMMCDSEPGGKSLWTKSKYSTNRKLIATEKNSIGN